MMKFPFCTKVFYLTKWMTNERRGQGAGGIGGAVGEGGTGITGVG